MMFFLIIERHDRYRVKVCIGGTWANVKKMGETLGTILHAQEERGAIRVRYSNANACPTCESTGLHAKDCSAAPVKIKHSLVAPRTELDKLKSAAKRNAKPRRIAGRIGRPE